ncbi:MAG: hypothetical protein COA69_04940 [Robiginitomaculum sp.]|nr:MAG: hypothetical protein COA69_04940 [Robiginitomaculum sp.]
MILTQDDFDTRYRENRLRIALVGMSNIGKSHWTYQITSDHNFKSYEVDAAIQAELSLHSVSQSAKWMGHPYEDGYAEKSALYLQHEAKGTLAANALDGNIVLDTTGSIIHLDKNIKNGLQNSYLTVYLKASTEAVRTLVERFNLSPKPLIWSTHYHKHSGQSDYDSMFTCYPNLLEAREKLYEQLADITLDVEALKDAHTTDFLTALRDALPLKT